MSKRHAYPMGLIGNCAYLAYIQQNANINWLCWPRFDSSFIFGGLLDEEKGGKFQISPENDQYESRQYYKENTNVLCTEFKTSEGAFRVIDFAPRFAQYDRSFKPLMLMRKIERISGQPRIRVICSPRGDYGETRPETSFGSNHIRYMGLKEQVRLTSNIPLNYIAEEKSFILTEDKYATLTWGIPLEASLRETTETFLDKTVTYWRTWVEQCSIPSIYQKEVIRSSLVLKLHQYEDTGAIIAAGTTSLPEHDGSGRNWDYRYFWVRDSYYTLSALNLLGHFEELDAYSHFLQNIVSRQQERFQPMYTISGEARIEESELPLAGYKGNQPVRLGNAAYFQIQNDVYGQIMLSLFPLYTDRRIVKHRRLKDPKLIHTLLDHIERTMDEPDAGLWEFRGQKQKHCYTFLFHWAGASAAIKIGRHLDDASMVSRAEKLKELAAKNIEACYNPELKAYTSAIGGSAMDASLFQLIDMQYLAPDSAKTQSHLKMLEEKLRASKGLFYRYKHEDDFGEPEVTFLVCGFWYVRALTAMGKTEQAIEAFEELLSSANHLGLLSEDVDAKDMSQWGNFVQTYSHVGVIQSAFDIDRQLNRQPFL